MTILAIFVVASSLWGSPAALPKGASYEVGFSPDRGSLPLVLKGIASAKSEILMASYSFTSKPIAQALLAAHKRGVKVEVVADEKSNRRSYSATTFLANQGVPVRLNGHYAIHHHKFLVIDRRHLETGSFNFTAAAADKNAENVLVLWNVPPLATTYATEWQRLWDEASPLPARY